MAGTIPNAKLLLATLAFLAATPTEAQRAPGMAGDTEAFAVAGNKSDIPSDNPHAAAPRIAIAANRDTIIAGLELLTWTATREAPLDEALTVTVRLTQEQNWLSNRSRRVTFAANKATADLRIVAGSFSSSVTESGNLTATVDSVSGYDTGDATATVYLFSQDGPAMKVFLSQEDYRFAEDAADPFVTLVVRAAAGMPRGATVTAFLSSRGGTATSPGDYEGFSETIIVSEGDFTLEDGRWSAQARLPITLVDDEVREGAESFSLLLDRTPGHPFELQLSDPGGSECPNGACLGSVEITDDEDIPEWELSVSQDEIMEEDEESSTATLSITNGKSFAADQVVTFAFAGTATEDSDYRVTPADADDATPDHQVILPAGSISLDVTLTAVDDDIEDSNEEIDITATLDGEAIGSPRTVRILNQETLPGITLAANRDTIIAGLENLMFTATREAPLDESLTVTVQLTQEQPWLSDMSHEVTFAADEATANMIVFASAFSSTVTESGNLTATVDSVSGYDTGDATTRAFVISQLGPAIRASIEAVPYTFPEDAADAGVTVMAWTAPGMPRGATVTFSVISRNGTARSDDDYVALSEMITVGEQDFRQVNGRWVGWYDLPVSLLDDEVREDTERFGLLLEAGPGHPSELALGNLGGSECQDPPCAYPVYITDDEDIPEWELLVNPEEIMEEGETSSNTILSIINGKTFAADQVLTFELGGDAIPGHDYRVTPADADDQTPHHQVALPAGSSSVEVTLTALDDEREEPTEKIRLSATHDGNVIASGTIRIVDRFPGPRVAITFEGVQPPRDEYDDGIATGPFTTRITFSEQVQGFTQEDIDWQTHSRTTVDTTNIGVLLWDYTEVRAGLEYTVRMMPDQNGRLHISVFPNSARSVATGDGNQPGYGSLQVELPPDRMMVEPRALTVDEGDADGAWFMVLLTSAPTGTVTATVSGMEGTGVGVNRSTLTFRLPYWSGGWGVRVTAADDANARDETVTLRVTASGGGYGGKSANVVVRVKDDDAVSGGDVDDEAAALILLEGMTAETAAAALFGDSDLSEAQRAALDHLGNGNGSYDLGDLLSWIERCRRGAVSCGETSRDALPGAAMPVAGAAGHGRRTSQRRRRGTGAGTRENAGNSRARARAHRVRTKRRSRRRAGRPLRRRSDPAVYGLALLLATTLTWACADDVLQPIPQPDPGYLTVQLTAPPDGRDIGAMLLVEGPGIDSVRAPGFELFQSEAQPARHIIIAGPLSTGTILQFRVSDRNDHHARYRVRLLQVTGEDYSLRDLSAYRAEILLSTP